VATIPDCLEARKCGRRGLALGSQDWPAKRISFSADSFASAHYGDVVMVHGSDQEALPDAKKGLESRDEHVSRSNPLQFRLRRAQGSGTARAHKDAVPDQLSKSQPERGAIANEVVAGPSSVVEKVSTFASLRTSTSTASPWVALQTISESPN
jgi:hypothetical protein